MDESHSEGKSTTVFTLLSNVDATRRSLLTVEDPVEYVIPEAKQQEVNERAGMTFESLLKSAMRQDPDILFLGEVRDAFSAGAVLEFASSGHLTISTLHSADAATAIFRLERLGVERGAMADALSVVVAQKLLRVLCPDCKETGPPTADERELLRRFTDDVPREVARTVGCPGCRDTGFHGRTGVYEVIRVDRDVARRIRDGRSVLEIRAFCHERGDLLLADHALHKIRQHLVSVDHARDRVLEEALDKRDAGLEESTDRQPILDQPEGAPETAQEAQGPAPEIDPNDTPETAQEATKRPARGPGSEEAPDSQPSPGAPADGSAGTVLVVEDSKRARRMLRSFLQSEGYRVVTVTDGVEALMELGSGSRIDAVISDLSMPHMDGEELLDMIREKNIDVPVLFVTASDAREHEAKLLEKGARDFLTKPVDRDVLLLRLRNALS